jgi:hypothetical protein
MLAHTLAVQIVPVDGSRGAPARGGGLNPFAALRRLASVVLDGHHLSKTVESRANEFTHHARTSGASAQPDGEAQASAVARPATAGKQPGSERRYTLQDLPTRRLLAAGAPPQLAWVPVRVALRLLAALPQHFVVLQGLLHGEGPRTAAGSRPQQLTAATTPGGLQVYVLQVGCMHVLFC